MVGLVVVAVALALAALGVSSVLAYTPTTLAEAGDGPGQIKGPNGVAVDPTSGDVYIADSGNQRIDQFDAAGAFVQAFGFGVRTGAKALEACTAATDCGPGTGADATFAGWLSGPAGIAVSAGAVWVSDNLNRVTEFTVDGGGGAEVLRSIGGDVVAYGPDDSAAGAVQRITVKATGGTFKLRLANPFTGSGAAETASLPYNASAAQVEAAVDAISTVGGLGGSVSVSGGPGNATGSSPYQVSFGGNFAGDFIPNFTTANALTGAVHTIAVAAVATGGAYEVCTPANGDVCKIGKAGAANGYFQQSRNPLAIDGSGKLWVGDQNRIQEFAPNGSYVGSVALPGRGGTTSFAVNSGGTKAYVISTAGSYSASVRVYETATGLEVGGPIDEVAGAYKTLALDSGEDLFVADRPEGGDAVFREFNPAGEQVKQLGAGQVFGVEGPAGIAVGDSPQPAIYAVSSGPNGGSKAQRFQIPGPGPLVYGEAARDALAETATLSAVLDPEGNETTYHFEYGTDESYGQSTSTDVLASGFYDESVEAGITGLVPDTAYHFRLVAEDSEGHVTDGPDQPFATAPAVQISDESVADVSATAAAFSADLDPLGPAAEWWVEYGAAGSYGGSTAKRGLPAGFGSRSASTRVGGLAPGTLYHYRFVAEDEREGVAYTAYGEDHTLTTQPGVSTVGLPDGRSWEMVTPVVKGGPILPLQEQGEVEAAAEGSAFTYIAQGSPGEEAFGSTIANQALAVRDPSLGWRQRNVTLPIDRVAGAAVGQLYPYRQFSPDLTEAIVQQSPSEDTLLSPDASEKSPYLRRQEACDRGASGCIAALVSGIEGAANVPVGTEFGNRVEYVGATPDLQQVILKSSVALTSEEAPAGGLYRLSTATRELRLISDLPDGEPAPAADLGGHNHPNVRHAVSPHGNRVIFASQDHLYLRDIEREETVQLDAVQAGNGSGKARATYQTASVSGSRVFFTSEQKLTPGAGAAENKPDLYVCDIGPDEATGSLECSLTDLTPRTSTGEVAAVRGIVPGASDDGSSVYFVANGALAPGATPGSCTGSFAPGAYSRLCNLYAIRFVGAEWQPPHPVAVISDQDRNDWAADNSWLGVLTSSVAPSGRWLAFMSSRPLTGADNRDAVSDERDEQVFVYDGSSGRLSCASCSPSGSRPDGAVIAGYEEEEIVDGQANWEGRWLAASVPGWTSAALNLSPLHQPRYLLDSGRLFFNSADALVPGDSNGHWDVYELEPPGVGDCTESSQRYAAANGGCLSLISSGSSAGVSTFMDASESGDDVFFWTKSKLTQGDRDTAADVYDARVCSTPSPCLPPPSNAVPCVDSSSCQGKAVEEAAGEGPGTASFTGRGNSNGRRGCAKAHRRRRGVQGRRSRSGDPAARRCRRPHRGVGR